MDGGIWGVLIGFNEATLVRNKSPSFTVFSCTCAKLFTLFGLLVCLFFRVFYTLMGFILPNIHLHNPFVQSPT